MMAAVRDGHGNNGRTRNAGPRPTGRTPLTAAARLRQQARDTRVRADRAAMQLERLADQIEADAAGVAIGGPAVPPLPPLAGVAELSAAYITAHPGTCGDVIARAIDCSADYFRSAYATWLKPRGFFNVPGGRGYFPPGWCDATFVTLQRDHTTTVQTGRPPPGRIGP